MDTDPTAQPATDLGAALRVLRAGGLVAVPTETVYGLAADAANADAVARIFAAKGRPVGHPLIVHVLGAEALDDWAVDVPEAARLLAARFWPGPLTLILRKAPRVPLNITGGKPTIGLRAPSHPLARALLRAFGGGIAAPSANRFGGVSPTTAQHVRDDLGDRVDLVLDGGACAVGIESTIVDLSEGDVVVLRPGAISREALAQALGRPVGLAVGGPVKAPGQLPSHYAPRAAVELAESEAGCLARRDALRAAGQGALAIASSEDADLRLPDDAAGFGEGLYAALRDADARGAEVVVIAPPPPGPLAEAILDRLQRAAAPRPEGD